MALPDTNLQGCLIATGRYNLIPCFCNRFLNAQSTLLNSSGVNSVKYALFLKLRIGLKANLTLSELKDG